MSAELRCARRFGGDRPRYCGVAVRNLDALDQHLREVHGWVRVPAGTRVVTVADMRANENVGRTQ